jgi:hypothetical protein
MSEAYRVMTFHHVTPSKRRRLLDDKLIPILDRFEEFNLLEHSIDDIMLSPYAQTLNIGEYDITEEQILTIQAMVKGDWLVEYYGTKRPIYLHKIDGYSHNRRAHLYIKHFAHIAHTFKVESSIFSEKDHETLAAASHLETMPLSFANMLEQYEELVKARDEKIKQESIELAKIESGRIKEKRRISNGTTSNRRPGRRSKNGEVRIIKPATNLTKK